MGGRHGKIKNYQDEILQHEKKIKCHHTFSLVNTEKSPQIFSVICCHTFEECIFQLIEFPQAVELKSIESQFGILNLTFKEFSTTKKIFEGILKTFQAENIKLPENIYVCIISRMWNIFFKFKETCEEEILKIKRNHINIIKKLEKNLPIENELEYLFLGTGLNLEIDVDVDDEKRLYRKGNKIPHEENFGKKSQSLIKNNSKKNKLIPKCLTEEDIINFSSNFQNLKIIPNLHQNLLGFFYEKFDYKTDKEFSSFYLIGLNSDINDYDIYKRIEIEKEIRIKEIIRNPFEDESIARVIIYNDTLNFIGNSTKIFIKELPLIILPIPYGENVNPEDLYKYFQVHLMTRQEIKNRNFLSKILEKNFGEIFTLNFLTTKHAVITFYNIGSVEKCLKKNQIFYHEEKEKIDDESVIIEKFIEKETDNVRVDDSYDSITLAFSRDINPTPITYKDITDDNKSVKRIKSFPIRPHKPYSFRNTYIPSIGSLLRNSSMWSYFKLENKFSNFVTVDELLGSFISNANRLKCPVRENQDANSPRTKTNTNTNVSNTENPHENEEYIMMKNNIPKDDRNCPKKENINSLRNFSSNNFNAKNYYVDYNSERGQNKFPYSKRKFFKSTNRNERCNYNDNKSSNEKFNDGDLDNEKEKDPPNNLIIDAIDKNDEANRSNFLDISELNQIFSQSESSFLKNNNDKEINIRNDEYRDELLNHNDPKMKNDDMFLDEFELLRSDDPNLKKKPIKKSQKEFLNLIPKNFVDSNKILDEMVEEIKKGEGFREKPGYLVEVNKSSGKNNKNKIEKLFKNKIQKRPISFHRNNFDNGNIFPKIKRLEFLKKKRKSSYELINISDDSSKITNNKKFDDIDVIIVEQEEHKSISAQEEDKIRTLSDCEKNEEIIIELQNISVDFDKME